MAVNKVDYEVLTSGVSVYSNQAGALDDVINSLVQMNGQLQDGWTNHTADAFIERFENEYKPDLRMQGMQSRVFLISFRITCRTDRMMMHRVLRL